jgi:catalase
MNERSPTDDLGFRLLDAVHDVTGVFPGHRALHAKGVTCVGSFTPTGAATPITTAPHLVDTTVPTTVRFSNGGPNPHTPDAARDGRGMATRFHLPDDTYTDIVALTLPVFFVRTPDDFIAFMAARVPDAATGQPDLDRIITFVGEHPECQQAVELSMGAPIPESYGRTRFFAIHAFWFVAADGTRHKIRYRWEPDAGIASLDDDAATNAEPDYLRHDLAARFDDGPIDFTLHLQVGGDHDDPDDPTIAWPDTNEEILAGRLSLTGLALDETAAEAMIYDPTRVTAGIECSADPILHARSAAYGASYSLRRR